MDSNLFISDKRMLEVLEYCIESRLSGVTNLKDWSMLVGIDPNNLPAIRAGARGFTKEHIKAVGDQFGISMEFIYGYSDDMFRSKKGITPMQMLKAAVRAVDREQQGTKLKHNLKRKTTK